MHSSAAVESSGTQKDPVAVKLLAAMQSQSGVELNHKTEECTAPRLHLPSNINSLLTIAARNSEIRHTIKASHLTCYLSLLCQMTHETEMLLCNLEIACGVILSVCARHENVTPPAPQLAFSTLVTILNHTDLPESSKHIIELTVNAAVKIMHVSTST